MVRSATKIIRCETGFSFIKTAHPFGGGQGGGGEKNLQCPLCYAPQNSEVMKWNRSAPQPNTVAVIHRASLMTP